MTSMTQRLNVAMLTLWTLSACHSLPPNQLPDTAPGSNAAPGSGAAPGSNTAPASGAARGSDAASSETTQPAVSSNAAQPGADDVANSAPAQIPACLPTDNGPKPAARRKSKAVVHSQPPPAAPVAEPLPKVVADTGVKTVTDPESSVLGRKVQGPQGDDMGRVVDVLADAHGRVRIAIIEFGGFLGVGNRRIAVDWSLLKFHPHDPDAPVVLDVTRDKLQETPEYKGTGSPVALMAPEIAASARSNTPH